MADSVLEDDMMLFIEHIADSVHTHTQVNVQP